MREEESAWLDRLEAQPMRRATEASGDATARGRVSSGVPGDGDIPGDEDETAVGAGSSQVPNLPAARSPAERHAAFAPFDPGATSYMRRNYAELVRLREEEHALVARLDRLAATEEELHARIEDATRRRDEALRRRDAERVPESRGGRAGAAPGAAAGGVARAPPGGRPPPPGAPGGGGPGARAAGGRRGRDDVDADVGVRARRRGARPPQPCQRGGRARQVEE